MHLSAFECKTQNHSDDRHTGCDDFSDRSGKIITNGYPVYGFADSFANIGQGYIAGIIPIPVVIFLIVILIACFILQKTYFGRYVYAMGSNAEAARLAGLNIDRMRIAILQSVDFYIHRLCADDGTG